MSSSQEQTGSTLTQGTVLHARQEGTEDSGQEGTARAAPRVCLAVLLEPRLGENPGPVRCHPDPEPRKRFCLGQQL